MLSPHDLPLEARTHRPVATDYAARHYTRLYRQHRRETALAKIVAALRGGEGLLIAGGVVLSLAVLTVLLVAI